MNYVVSKLSGLTSDKRAVTALEYAMIASLIAVALVAVLGTLSGSISGVFSHVANVLGGT